MKTRRSILASLFSSKGVRTALLASSALVTLSATSMGQMILVADPNGTNGVRSYQMDGTLINSSLVPGDGFQGLALSGSTLYIGDATTGDVSIRRAILDGTGGVSSTSFFTVGGMANGLNSPFGLALTAAHMYIANLNTGFVFKYDLSTGNQVNSLSTNTVIGGNSFITSPYGVAISGDTLFVSAATTGNGANTINGYSLTTFSSTPTMTLTTNLSNPHGLAVSGNTLYVANGGNALKNGTIERFNATTGASIGTLVSGLGRPQGIMVYGSTVYVTGAGDGGSDGGTVTAFDTSTGSSAAGFTTITGLSSPHGIVIAPVPEPATYGVIIGVAMLGLIVLRCRKIAGVA